MNRDELIALIKEALRDPRRSGARIGAMALPGVVIWESLVLVSVVSVISLYLMAIIAARGDLALIALPMPAILLVMQTAAMLVLATGLAVFGRMAKGTGDFAASLRIIVWLQGLMVLVQVIQLVVLVVLPMLSNLLSLVSLVLMAWLATGLVAGLHGFRSLPLTFAGMIGGLFVLAFVMSLALAPFLSMPV